MPYHGEELRREIRKLRGLFYGHQKIIDTLQIPASTYYYHWNIIKEENKRVYDKLTEENIREDVERTIAGLEQKIRELQEIIDQPETQQDKRQAIETQSQIMSWIPKIRQQGGAFIETIGSEHSNTREREAHTPEAR